jgi:ribosomal protein L11 methylase PrmA
MLEGKFDYTPNEEIVPIRISDTFYICYGPEVRPPNGADDCFVRLHKSDFFGTGGHPSSKAAIAAMCQLCTDYYTGAVVDPMCEVGDTTGLLALVAAYTGTENCYHVSDNPASFAEAEYNGIVNGYEIRQGTIKDRFGPDLEDEGSFFQLAACQTGGDPKMIDKIPDIFHSVNEGGSIVWSGHKIKQHRAIYHRIGEFFTELDYVMFGDWPAIIGTKATSETNTRE